MNAFVQLVRKPECMKNSEISVFACCHYNKLTILSQENERHAERLLKSRQTTPYM